MQAAVLHHFGSIEEHLRLEARPLPVLKPGHVLVRMAAASINPSDLVFLLDQYGIHKPLPVVPGFEGSGTVVASTSSLYGRWLVGKRVACHAPKDADGTWAEYMACPATTCVPLKKKVTLDQGASLYVNPLTAWILLQRIKQKGHSAFIQTAAASAVDRMVARLARRQGLQAIHVVRRAEQVMLLKSEGAEHILDSSDPGFSERLKTLAQTLNATIALDAVGGSLTAVLAQALPQGGDIMVYGALGGGLCTIHPADLIFKGKTLSGFWLTHLLQTMTLWEKMRAFSRVQDLLETDLKTHVQARFPLEKIHAAITHYKTQRTQGKVLLTFP